jgi:hypothetical protein
MSLDQNLFTLNIVPNGNDPSVLDLVDPSGTVHYHKERVPEANYKMNLYGEQVVHFTCLTLLSSGEKSPCQVHCLRRQPRQVRRASIRL